MELVKAVKPDAMKLLILVVSLSLVTGCVSSAGGFCLQDSDCPLPTIHTPNGNIKAYCENFQCKIKTVCDDGYEFVKGSGCVFSPENACTSSGGTVTTSLCCLSVGDFPRTDLIGACGCSPENSHEVKTCDCGAKAVWNGTKCVSYFALTEVESGSVHKYFDSKMALGDKKEFVIRNESSWEIFYKEVKCGKYDDECLITVPEIDFETNLVLAVLSEGTGAGNKISIDSVYPSSKSSVDIQVLRIRNNCSSLPAGIDTPYHIVKVRRFSFPLQKFKYVDVDNCKTSFCGWSTYSGCGSDADCVKEGCSMQVCASKNDKPIATTCEYRECYDSEAYGKKCGCISNQCQWY
ncbi:MAG: eight-cysteine-cluster domain-containing protein [archaeon]